MKNIYISRFIVEAISCVGTVITMLIVRYLLCLSTPEEDYRWLEQQPWFIYLRRLEFYRGLDFFYQVRSLRIINGL